MPTPALPIDALELQTVPVKGKAPASRLKDMQSAHAIYVRVKDADDASSENRASFQAMFGGEPPYNDSDLVNTGQGFRTNINFGEAANLLEQAQSAYVDMLHSVETLMTVKVTKGEPAARVKYEEIIAEELSRTIRNWPRFNYSFLENCRNFIADGISICYFENELDWKWRVVSLADFVFPRKTQASEGDLEVAFCRRGYLAHQLYSFIRDEKVAKAAGWNVPVVRAAISEAAKASENNYGDWEALQVELKNNDLYCSADSAEIDVIHMWVQEFDQTVSHYMFRADGEGGDFLYKKPSRFTSMEQALVFFTYGIGTNGYYHGIRGLGYKIFPQIQVSNRLNGQVIDSAMLASSLMVQPQSEEAAEDMSLIYYGPYAVITPGLKVIERVAPNLSQSVLPILNNMSNQIQAKSGQYTQNALADTREKTKFEVATQLESIAKLSVTSMNLFYEPWGRLLREVARRLTRKDYGSREPGGREALECRKRCELRGVPAEVFFSLDVDLTKAVRAVGAGSQAARQLVFSDLDSMASSMDPQGRNTYLRERLATRVGWENVDKYVAPVEDGRPTDDDRFAELENKIMVSSQLPVTVRPNDLHIVHLRQHIPEMDRIVAAVDKGETQIAQATPMLALLHAHSSDHLSLASGDASAGPELPAMIQRIQQLGEIVYNGVEHIQRLQREQASAPAQPGAAPQGPSLEEQKATQELQRRIIEHQVKVKQVMELHQLKLRIEAERATQQRLLADAATAAKITRDSP